MPLFTLIDSKSSSFFQSVCLLGYCLFPLNLAAIINLGIGSSVHILIKLAYVGVAFIWSTYCKLSNLSNFTLYSFGSLH